MLEFHLTQELCEIGPMLLLLLLRHNVEHVRRVGVTSEVVGEQRPKGCIPITLEFASSRDRNICSVTDVGIEVLAEHGHPWVGSLRRRGRQHNRAFLKGCYALGPQQGQKWSCDGARSQLHH